MNYKDYIKTELLPAPWCPGCGIGIVFNAVARSFAELNLKKQNLTVISGIGCTGRAAGFFKLDTIHTLHGRPVPVAEGVKNVKPGMDVVVLSGDGDLLGIGGNHLIHASRRNTNISVVCVENEIYGMTGGQKSPATPLEIVTNTSPYGNKDMPFNSKSIVRAHNGFYARSTTAHLPHLINCIKEAINHKGFTFVDVKSQCIESYGKRLGFKSAYEMMEKYKKDFVIVEDVKDLKDNELGVLR